MSTEKDRKLGRQRRHLRVRRKVTGTAEHPRLCVYKSLRHLYAQVVDDTAGATLVAAGTVEPGLAEALSSTRNLAAAAAVGKAVAERALARGISRVVFDRGGWPYHGRVRALAQAAREAGLQF